MSAAPRKAPPRAGAGASRKGASGTSPKGASGTSRKGVRGAPADGGSGPRVKRGSGPSRKGPPRAAAPLDLANPVPLHRQGVLVRGGPPPASVGGRSDKDTRDTKRARFSASSARTHNRPEVRTARGKAPQTTRGSSRRSPSVPAPSRVTRVLVLVLLGALALWVLPAFGPSGDAVLSTPMVFWLLAILVVTGAGAAGLRIAWRWPGLLAVLGILWAGALVPDVLAPGVGTLLPSWPAVPAAPAAVALWRILALVLGAAAAGVLAVSHVPRRVPTSRPSRVARR